MKTFLYLAFLYFFVSCSSNTKVSADSGLPILDLTQDFPERELDIHEIAEVEYIPLETNDSSLIKMAAKIMISDKYIITYDFQGPVFIFDRKGKHIRSINHYGQGPKEHNHIFFVAVDFKKEEYYVHTINNKIQVYDFYGEWKRTLKYSEGIFYDYFFDCNERYFISVNEYHDLTKAHLAKKYPERFNNIPIDLMPYHLIDKETWNYTPLPITIKEWMSTTFDADIVRIDEYTATTESNQLSIPRILANGHDFLIPEFSKDTLYTYKDNRLTPLAVRYPSVHSTETPVVISPFYYTDDYLFFKPVALKVDDKNYQYKSYDEAPLLMWNRKNNEIQHITYFYDSNIQGGRAILANMKNQWIEQPNCAMNGIPAYQLCEAYEAGKLKGKLKEVASKLKEDDNDVIIIYKFK